MAKKDLTFASLVEQIDAKWGHTYLDPGEDLLAVEINEIFDSLEDMINTEQDN
jgi:hypothetical protein